MKRKAYKFRLKPSKDQIDHLEKFAGCGRFVWNKVLRLSLDRLKNRQNLIWYNEASFWVTLWKKSEEYGFLAGCGSQVLQQKLKDLDKAFKNAFDKKQPLKRIPKFRKKGIHDSIRFPQGFKVINRRIYLPKIGWIPFFKSQKIAGKIKNITISRKGKHWDCAIQIEVAEEKPSFPIATSAIGIDLGISKFASLSTGHYINPVNSFRNMQQLLAKAQRKLAKKRRFSNNWRKQKQEINDIHSRIANIRNDFLHKVSTKLSKNHALIVVEGLKISNMSKSASGTIDSPGRKVKAKSGLNKSILDQGWGKFKAMLKYKLEWNGGNLIEVDPKYTSQKCSKCQNVCKENRQTQAKFSCLNCGFESNADINAAKNILAAGHAVLACGEKALAFSMKQEPLGMSNLVPA